MSVVVADFVRVRMAKGNTTREEFRKDLEAYLPALEMAGESPAVLAERLKTIMEWTDIPEVRELWRIVD